MAKPHYLTSALNLGLSQAEVDFVDINLNGDLRLFIDPYFLGKRKDSFSIDATKTLRNFFSTFLELLRDGEEDEALGLFLHLKEPNETGLGLSRGRSRGNGIGEENAQRIFESLKNSTAVQTGLVEHIEDARLFVQGIDKDKISDMATNIIRRHLIDYTKRQCKNLGIRLTQSQTGFMWLRDTQEWVTEFDQMLIVEGRSLLLVPKSIVSYSDAYSAGVYHNYYILNFLQNEHLRLGTSLVEHRKNKKGHVSRFVTKKRLRAEVAPPTKEFITKFTQSHPNVFASFKDGALTVPNSLSLPELSREDLNPILEHLRDKLIGLRTGRETADEYEKLIAAVLEVLFYPALTNPVLQHEIHNGRKRLDIIYENAANDGLFLRLFVTHGIPSMFIFVECKNYSEDPKNPELDQLAGRFSNARGKFGLIVCRSIEKMDLFLSRCADTHHDGRGTILPLTDDDLVGGLNALAAGNPLFLEGLLRERLRTITVR